MITLQFKHCRVIVWPEQQHLVTIFEDGTEVPACPNYDDESKARALSLGYGEDLWAMTIDHELGHTILAEMDNLKVSPALWAVAHPNENRNAAALDREESRVLEMQKFHRLLSAVKEKLSSP